MSKKLLVGRSAALAIALAIAGAAGNANASVVFTTFVSSSGILGAEGQLSPIAFNYAGSFFVGSVYPSNSQLYSTDLLGGNVQKFGQPIPGFSGEIVVAAGLGQDSFAKGAIYAGNGSGNQIYLVPAVGAPTLFGTTGNSENIRQILFDPGNTFGGAMLVSTSSGRIYSFDATGTPTLLASVGSDTEGMDIASAAYGKYAGSLLVTSEGTGHVSAISPLPGHAVTTLQSSGGGAITLGLAETLSVVPLDLGLSGNPLEGFYVANYPSDIQFADASQFAGLQGDAIITQEFGSNSPLWDLKYNGDALDTFTLTQIGILPLQSEDGIFVTAQRILDVNPPSGVPEPISLSLFGAGLAGIGAALRRKKKAG